MKIFKKVVVATLIATTMTTGAIAVVQAGNRDTNIASGCSRDTASGNNRSGTCALTSGGGSNPRTGRAPWSHQQFNLSTSASSVSRGSFSTAHMNIVVHNGVTATNSMTVRHGNTGTVTRNRVAFFRPYSAAVLGQ